MYEKYFGLEEKPFSIAPDPRFLFMSPRHREALGHLVYGISEGGGFVQLTGEVGTGKTTISRCLLEQIPDHVDVALILNPKLNALELLATICDELHVAYEKDAISLKVLVDALNKYLLQTHAEGRRTVLIIDEAQNLSAEVLEQIRLLTNLETSEQKLLQILLIGQPELRDLLAREDMRQLAQRITARYHLEPLSMNETQAYIQHRLAVCGVQSKLFDKKALHTIYQYTAGVPRLINVLCDRALLGAYVEESRQVTRAIVHRAAAETLPESRLSIDKSQTTLKALFLLLLLVVVAGLVWQSKLYQSSPRELIEKNLVVKSETIESGGAMLITLDESEVIAGVDRLIAPAVIKGLPEAVQSPRFIDVLNDFEGSGRMDAWRVLLGRWDVLLNEGAVYGAPCKQMHQYQLSCLQGQGTLDQLREFNRPSLIKVNNAQGHEIWLVLLSITAEGVELTLGDQSHMLALNELADIWYGDYILLWRPRLNALTVKEKLIDKASVIRFQQQQGLEPDGVVGAKTLIHLQNKDGSANAPHLVPNRE